MPHKFQNFYISDRMMKGIDNYINEGITPGGFLTAVITNDLMEAAGRADEENLQNIPAYCDYFYNEAPMSCWGSKEKMKAWLDKFIKNSKEES